MKILFDQGTPAPLRHELTDHEVKTAVEMGWPELNNGELLDATERLFDLFITTDQNLGYQQNITRRKLAILVLPTTSWPQIQKHSGQVVQAVSKIKPGQFLELRFTA